MKVLYYTAPPFLDIAIEVINILKNECELHVVIEVTPNSVHRLGIDKIPVNQSIIDLSDIIDREEIKYFKPYFVGCASVKFLVNSSESGFSLSTFKMFLKTYHYINNIKPDIIHIESLSLRSMGVVPFLFSRIKVFFTVHDPIPHTGESNWKVILPRLLFLRFHFAKSYFFYSEFSKMQFEEYYKKDKYPKFLLRMFPYSFYKNYSKTDTPAKDHILFFGAISKYKGVDVLIKSMPYLLADFPNEILIVAGRVKDGIKLDQSILEKYKDQIIILDRYIQNDELVSLISASKFVVCPYLDATQSGVLMTAFALNKPVIATNVGAFSEYINDNVTGILVPVNDPVNLANAMKLALKDNFYEKMEDNIKQVNNTTTWNDNLNTILIAYKLGC